jgi:rod shape-determining protein MreD
MRWLTFAILAGIVVVAQTSLAQRLEVGSIRPEWAIILAAIYVMHAFWFDGLVAAWIVGLSLDLCSGVRLGLFSLTFGLTALVIIQLRGLFFREHVLTHLFLIGLFAFLVTMGVGVYRLVFAGQGTSFLAATILVPLLTAGYAAVWAVPAYFLFERIRPWMGLKPQRTRR